MNAQRKEKLKSILYAILELDDVSAGWSETSLSRHQRCVRTKVLNQLTRDGLLMRIERENRGYFRWVRNTARSTDHWIDSQVYGEQVKQSPEQDRPRELLLRDGVAKLTDAQLIAILIRVGTVGRVRPCKPDENSRIASPKNESLNWPTLVLPNCEPSAKPFAKIATRKSWRELNSAGELP